MVLTNASEESLGYNHKNIGWLVGVSAGMFSGLSLVWYRQSQKQTSLNHKILLENYDIIKKNTTVTGRQPYLTAFTATHLFSGLHQYFQQKQIWAHLCYFQL